MPVSFREKSAWISLTTTLVIWGSYFWAVYQRAATGRISSTHLLDLFAECAFTLIAVQVVLGIVAGILQPRQALAPADERERLMAFKATHLAFYVLSIAVLCVAASTPFVAGISTAMFHDPIGDATVLMANGILLAVVLAELVKSGAQIVYFRRGY